MGEWRCGGRASRSVVQAQVVLGVVAQVQAQVVLGVVAQIQAQVALGVVVEGPVLLVERAQLRPPGPRGAPQVGGTRAGLQALPWPVQALPLRRQAPGLCRGRGRCGSLFEAGVGQLAQLAG